MSQTKGTGKDTGTSTDKGTHIGIGTDKISILFQNEEIIVVNKPEGISVHNNEDEQNLIITLEKENSFSKLYPIHRLDKETSGIQILALNNEAAQKYSSEFQNRQVKKIYHGVLRGQLKEFSGSWTRPLSDKAEGRKNPQGQSKDRVPCETKFSTIKQNKYFTLCEFELITGRQHQIRKHTALANHPLVGDSRYGENKYNEKIKNVYSTSRMFLHCSHIKIFNLSFESTLTENFYHLFRE